MKIIACTGLSGVLGKFFLRESSFFKANQVVELFNTKPTTNNSQQVQLNLLKTDTIIPTLKKINPDIVLHLAAVTHIDACEVDRVHGEAGKVWQTNVVATKKISQYCKQAGKKLLFMSTECVFDGEQTSYSESALQNPKNWYGITKTEAEKYIQKNNPTAAIIRGVVAYHPADTTSSTIFGKLQKNLKSGLPFSVVGDQFFTPTSINDIISSVEVILEQNLAGVFHIAPQTTTTPFAFAVELATGLGYDATTISKTTLRKYLGKERAAIRLKHAVLDSNATEKKLGITFKTLKQALKNNKNNI